MTTILIVSTLLAAALCYPAWLLYEWTRSKWDNLRHLLRQANDCEHYRIEYARQLDTNCYLKQEQQRLQDLLGAQTVELRRLQKLEAQLGKYITRFPGVVGGWINSSGGEA